MSIFAARLRKLRPFRPLTSQVIRSNESLAGFVWRAWQLYRHPDRKTALRLYLFSLLYLALLFAAMVLDARL